MKTMKNAVKLIGRTGRTPEIRRVGKTKCIARFPLATDDFYMDDEGAWAKRTSWHSMVAFGRIAETIGKHLAKGQQIAVEGKLSTNIWEDPEGNKRRRVDIVINQIFFLQKAN